MAASDTDWASRGPTNTLESVYVAYSIHQILHKVE